MQVIEFDSIGSENFSVDTQRRTITGVVVPWGKVGKHNDGKRWRFEPGSLLYTEAKYVTFKEEHDESLRFGRGSYAEETDQGFVMSFKVSPGQYGDKMLAFARDGLKTGLSVEVDIDNADMVPDPDNRGVQLIKKANLTGVALVRNPAFDDAQVISVMASRDNGKDTGMPDIETAPEETPVVEDKPTEQTEPTPVMFSAEQFDTLINRLGNVQNNGNQGRQVVNPLTNIQVNEPLPYRFSYQGGKHVFRSDSKHDFSTDLYAAMEAAQKGRDYSAEIARLDGFVKAAFDVDRADTTDVTKPHGYRPDLWQPQLDLATPLWEMVASGDTDGSKFDIPKFNSSSGMVGPATEATEPAAGAFAATLQTITPTQVWGKVEITRQAWRAGGNPQISGILWDQMLREYYEDREAAVATFLATLTAAADITLTGRPATTPDNDDDQQTTRDLEAAIAVLQFVRGGNRFRAFAVHQDLYTLLARTEDDAGRPKYPILNPQNANGTAAELFKTMNIAGTTAIGAAALGAGGQTTATNSWLFDPAKVRGWASTPERMFWDFGATVQSSQLTQLAYVTLGIYGDVAFGNLDINGVRQVIFDPSV